MSRAILTLPETTQLIAEGAGAATTATAFKIRNELQGKRIVLALTEGNLTLSCLEGILRNKEVEDS